MRLVLASRSPRRAHILAAAGFKFDVVDAEVDETPREQEEPATYVVRLAREKAMKVVCKTPGIIVVGADTTVVAGGRLLGKPADRKEAKAMLEALSGRFHDVFTGVAVRKADRVFTGVERTRVWFAQMSPEEIAWYVDTEEPQGKAGAYAIQGVGSRFVERIEGSYANVVGFPVALVYRMLKEVGWVGNDDRPHE